MKIICKFNSISDCSWWNETESQSLWNLIRKWEMRNEKWNMKSSSRVVDRTVRQQNADTNRWHDTGRTNESLGKTATVIWCSAHYAAVDGKWICKKLNGTIPLVRREMRRFLGGWIFFFWSPTRILLMFCHWGLHNDNEYWIIMIPCHYHPNINKR